MKFTTVLLACLVAGSAATNDFKALKQEKKARIKAAKSDFKAALKAGKDKGHGDGGRIVVPGPVPVHPVPDVRQCETVFDEVWEEKCWTKYDNACEQKVVPDCRITQARECYPKEEESCSYVMEQKCKRVPVPFCDVVWEKQCTNEPVCTKIFEKECQTLEKDVCVTHFEKVCTMHTVKECRHVPEIREPVHGVWKRSLHKKADKKAGKKNKGANFAVPPRTPYPPQIVSPGWEAPVKTTPVCTDVQKKVCNKEPKEVCHKQPFDHCRDVPRENCVDREKCTNYPKKNCGLKEKETCVPVPTKKCVPKVRNICTTVPHKSCTDVTKEVCKSVPVKECKKDLVKRPRQVCSQPTTVRVIDEW